MLTPLIPFDTDIEGSSDVEEVEVAPELNEDVDDEEAELLGGGQDNDKDGTGKEKKRRRCLSHWLLLKASLSQMPLGQQDDFLERMAAEQRAWHLHLGKEVKRSAEEAVKEFNERLSKLLSAILGTEAILGGENLPPGAMPGINHGPSPLGEQQPVIGTAASGGAGGGVKGAEGEVPRNRDMEVEILDGEALSSLGSFPAGALVNEYAGSDANPGPSSAAARRLPSRNGRGKNPKYGGIPCPGPSSPRPSVPDEGMMQGHLRRPAPARQNRRGAVPGRIPEGPMDGWSSSWWPLAAGQSVLPLPPPPPPPAAAAASKGGAACSPLLAHALCNHIPLYNNGCDHLRTLLVPQGGSYKDFPGLNQGRGCAGHTHFPGVSAGM